MQRRREVCKSTIAGKEKRQGTARQDAVALSKPVLICRFRSNDFGATDSFNRTPRGSDELGIH